MLRNLSKPRARARSTQQTKHPHPQQTTTRLIKSTALPQHLPTAPTLQPKPSSILTICRRNLAKKEFDKPRKLSQAEMIIQQHKAKQQEALQKKAAAAAPAATPSSTKPSSQSPTGQQNSTNPPSGQGYQQSTSKPMQQPSREFLRDQRSGKERALPKGMTIEQLNQMPPEVIAKTLNIDMSIVDSMNDDQEDEFPVKFSEDDNADATPPMPFKGNQDGASYSASRIQGRHTINMMPSVAPRPHNHKGRVTIIRKLPPQFEKVHSKLRTVTQALLRLQKLAHFDLAVTLVAAQGMQYINKQHRFVDAPTDVISFTMEEPYCEGIPVELGNIADLGEIIISVPYIYAQASIRHTMLRQMGFDLSDSKRPLNDMDKLKKLFASVGEIAINDDGSLRIDAVKDVVDVEQDATPFGQNAYKLAGNSSLPHITLTSSQLDTLPPFDKDFLSSAVHGSAGAVDGELMAQANQLRQARSIQKTLELQGGDASMQNILQIQNEITGKGGVSMTSTSSTMDPIDQFNQNSLMTASKWTLSQGFPPRDYFKYITESMVIDEMNIVLIHGFLHLCGYDHDTSERRANMQAETDRMVAALLKDGVISQRCADLATLYDLEEAPDVVDEASEDDLLPAGLFMDPDVKPMTDEQIAAKLKEYELEQDEEDAFEAQMQSKATTTAKGAAQGRAASPLDAEVIVDDSKPSRNPKSSQHQQQQQQQQLHELEVHDENMTLHNSGPTGPVRVYRSDDELIRQATGAQHQTYGATHASKPSTTKSTDIFRKKK